MRTLDEGSRMIIEENVALVICGEEKSYTPQKKLEKDVERTMGSRGLPESIWEDRDNRRVWNKEILVLHPTDINLYHLFSRNIT